MSGFDETKQGKPAPDADAWPVKIPAPPLEVRLQDDAEALADQGAPADITDAWPVRITDGNAVPTVKVAGAPPTSADNALTVALAPGAVVSGTVTSLQGTVPSQDNLVQVGGQPISLSSGALPTAPSENNPLLDVLRQILSELQVIRAGITYLATEGGRVLPQDLDPNVTDFSQPFTN